MKIILNLFKELLYIIYDSHSKVLIAKYDGSRMNDACTISSADFVSRTAKIVQSTTFFSKKKAIFVQLLHQPPSSWLMSQHMDSHL